jgi:hypothetical protein
MMFWFRLNFCKKNRKRKKQQQNKNQFIELCAISAFRFSLTTL